jgi:hypothetical protein
MWDLLSKIQTRVLSNIERPPPQHNIGKILDSRPFSCLVTSCTPHRKYVFQMHSLRLCCTRWGDVSFMYRVSSFITNTYFVGKAWSLTRREERRLSLRTRCWGEYLEQRWRKWREAGEDCIMRGFITCTLHKIRRQFENSWTDASAPLLCRGRRWLLCQVVVAWSSSP